MQRLIIGLTAIFVTLAYFLSASPAISAPVPELTDAAPVEGQWLIKVAGDADPRSVAESAGAEYVGPLEGVAGYHRVRFIEQVQSRPDVDPTSQIVRQLQAQSKILKFEQEELIVRYPKVFNPVDPLFSEQWHLENTGQSGGTLYSDLQVRPVWDQGINGTGVVVAVIDTGIEYTHPDLSANYLSGSGYDYNDGDTNPSPVGFDDRHGTSVAGITLASSNAVGGMGIAYKAKLVPIRLIAGPFATGDEAQALSYRKQEVDIYNNSWGPSDDAGVRYAPASEVMKDAVGNNVATGRGGLGNIYVWAAGNGGLNGDNSNFDGYNSLPYTISVGAVGDDDIKAGYSEPGANLLVVAPSGGRGGGILTTDNTGSSGYVPGDYYSGFSGTSAAAPMVSGVVALMLDARPGLNWRDVQQILARTAVPVDFSSEKWVRNGAGLWVSHEYGFGRVDAHAALQLTGTWQSLPAMLTTTRSQARNVTLLQNQLSTGSIFVSSDMEVQFVRVTLELSHSDWGDIEVELESPVGTRRTLATPHANANTSGTPGTWTYLSTQHLGENAQGYWKLHVRDAGSAGTGSWTSWGIEVMGHDLPSSANRNPAGTDLSINSIEYPVTFDTLGGMSDPDGDPVSILSVQYPRYGTLVDLGSGSFEYTMGSTRDGTDTFSILAGDGRGGVSRRIIKVLNPLPVCQDDLYPVASGSTLDLPVLGNDRDPDGDLLRITSISGDYADYATVVNGQYINFQVPGGFRGVACLTYGVTDDSDGESSGKVTLVVDESPEIAMSFDGEDDHLILQPTSQVSMNDNFTVEAWIYPESYGEYVTGFGRIYDRDTFVLFLNGYDHAFYNDRSLVIYLIAEGGRPHAINSGINTIELNRWQHVAVTYSSSDPFGSPVRVYIDGQPVSVSYPSEVTTTRPGTAISDNSPWPLYIGESDSGARAFRGRMTEFRIWDRVLGAATIEERHDLRMTGGEPGLRLYLPLDQTLETRALSTGSYKGYLDIFEAIRVPFAISDEELHSHYTLLEQDGQGWWHEKTLGWIYGSQFPWIYSHCLGWLYTGHPEYSCQLQLYAPLSNWGWMQTSELIFPWFNRISDGRWLWHLENTSHPALFYDPERSDWLIFDDN